MPRRSAIAGGAPQATTLCYWGESGHRQARLLHAAGTYARRFSAVVHSPPKPFTNDFINSLREASFKRSYRDIDVLLVDDIHHRGPEGVQEEFFHTFNTLAEREQADRHLLRSSA